MCVGGGGPWLLYEKYKTERRGVGGILHLYNISHFYIFVGENITALFKTNQVRERLLFLTYMDESICV